MKKTTTIFLGYLLVLGAAHAAEKTSTVMMTADRKTIGSVSFTESPFGLMITPNLSGLQPGVHGFHLHQHPNCGDHGNDAGGHFDPQKTNSHQGPYGKGHLGDLPVLAVNADGKANVPTLAPRLKLSDIKGLTVMVHANGDNYSDNPPLGGGGTREACGVIQ